MFNAWSKILIPGVELFLINLPGRDRRLKEPLQLQLAPLIETLSKALYPWLEKPFAFFGHSMGALLSFETALELRRRFSIQPVQLFVSGCRPPHIPDPNPAMQYLPDEEFLKTTQHYYGALPEIILKKPDMLQLFMKIMRADTTMVESHVHRRESPLDCPISAFGGLQDPAASEQGLAAWRDNTTADFKLQMFPGDHFFLQSARAALLQSLNNEISQLLSAQGNSSRSDGS